MAEKEEEIDARNVNKVKRDIENIDDIKVLVDSFYQQAVQDTVIKHFFLDIMDIRLQDHLPVIYSFWDSVLFGTATYKGNVMLKHIALHNKSKIAEAHFDRWLQLWSDSVQSLFEGKVATDVIQKAKNMKTLMMYKIEQSNNSGFIL